MKRALILLVCMLCGRLSDAEYDPLNPPLPFGYNPDYPPPPLPGPVPNDGSPQFSCDLNDDEYGRPYLTPSDEHLFASALFHPHQKIQSQSSASANRAEEAETEFVKRQATSSLPACTVLNECSAAQERCSGLGTQYDSCGRRCSCVGGFLKNCCRVRKEWRSMTQNERCRYIDAVVAVSTQPQYKSCYSSIVKLHTDNFNNRIHDQAYFLPWHRWYILQLENLLRKFDCRVTMPYWDWSLESETWKNSVVWSTSCGFGGNGNPQQGNRVTTGPFAPSAWPTPDGQPLTRDFSSPMPNCAALALVQRMTVQQFNLWHAQIRGQFHNSPHCYIGGTMCQSRATNDPIFYLHHGFVDSMWSDWQNKEPANKNLAFYSQNTTPMPGAFGATPAMMYDLQNQPGCVKVCIQQPDTPCAVGSSVRISGETRSTLYNTPVCSSSIKETNYSPFKLSSLIQRPYPLPSQTASDLFHETYEERILTKRFATLMNDEDLLNDVIHNSGYNTDVPKISQTSDGSVDFERHVYRPLIFQQNYNISEVPETCLQYLYGKL